MQKPPVPDEVRRFILTSVPSVPYLEALLLLRSRPQDAWDAPLVARRLYIGEAQALALLHSLGEAAVAAAVGNGLYQYAPQADGLRQVIDALAQTYSADLLGVTELIHSRIDKRALQFADAFRWTKKEN
jgi:hypothetical protein